MLHLIGVAGLFDEDQLVPVSGRQMGVQIAKKGRRISAGEIVIGAHKKRAAVRDLFRLGKVPVLCCVNVVEDSGKLPVISGVGNAFHPSHKGKGQHLIAVAAFYLIAGEMKRLRKKKWAA